MLYLTHINADSNFYPDSLVDGVSIADNILAIEEQASVESLAVVEKGISIWEKNHIKNSPEIRCQISHSAIACSNYYNFLIV